MTSGKVHLNDGSRTFSSTLSKLNRLRLLRNKYWSYYKFCATAILDRVKDRFIITLRCFKLKSNFCPLQYTSLISVAIPN